MKFLVISDMHGKIENIEKLDSVYSEVDGILCAGDFAEFNKEETGLPLLNALSTKHENIFSVIGNCDNPEFIGEIESKDISVQKNISFFNGLAIAGSGGASIFTNSTPNERTEDALLSDFEIVKNTFETSKDENGKWNNLILISHNPPKCSVADSPCKGVHAGSDALAKFITDVAPVLVITGHIHEGVSIEKIDNTTVINPGALFEGKYAIVELEKIEENFIVKDARLLNL